MYVAKSYRFRGILLLLALAGGFCLSAMPVQAHQSQGNTQAQHSQGNTTKLAKKTGLSEGQVKAIQASKGKPKGSTSKIRQFFGTDHDKAEKAKKSYGTISH